MTTRQDQQAQQITIDATVIKLGLHAALHAIDEARAGWPTSTPGCSPITGIITECPHDDCANTRPCPTHDTAHVQLTATEQNAATHDQAGIDHDRIHADLNHAATTLARLANLVTKWAWGNLNDSQISARLTAIDASIWCKHCSRYGRHEPREETRQECTFCRQFAKDYKQPPPKEIWDARDARNGRLDQTTILRILKQVKARQAAEAKARKTAKRVSA